MSRVSSRIATPAAKRRYVRRLFATIADRYDFITVALSYGRDRAWKRRLIRRAAPLAGKALLDVATGTGDIAFLAARAGARVVALDITPRMIELARAKAAGHDRAAFLIGDMAALPIASASFDVVTTGYGLRNAADLGAALDEIRRVLRPGGAMMSLDFNRPSSAIVRTAYFAYLWVVGGALGWLLHGDPDTYRYIPASISRYPGAAGIGAMLSERGFLDVTYDRLLGGLMTLHCARKSWS